MHPVLIEIPSLDLRIGSANAFVLLAVLFCVAAGPRWAASLEGLDAGPVRRALLVLAVVVLAGARLHFALAHPTFYAGRWPTALLPWSGGFHIGGGIVALALAAPAVTRRLGVPLGRFGDGITPALGVGVVLARIGCFLHGCCFGLPCTGPWCVRFPSASAVFGVQRVRGLLPADAATSLPVHPLQLYFALAGVAVTAGALWLGRRKRRDGQVALVGLLVFAATTAALEPLRGDDGLGVFWGPFSQLEWTALALTTGAAVALVVAGRRTAGRTAQRRPSPAAVRRSATRSVRSQVKY